MQNWLDKGNWNSICDSCGKKFKASRLRKRWDGLMVCLDDFEIKHPQLSLRVKADKIVVPVVRREAPDIFLEYCTYEGSQGTADYATADCAMTERVNATSLG